MAVRTVEEIAADLALAKTNENNAKKRRIELEEELIAQYELASKERKTVKLENGLTVTMQSGFSYKLLPDYPSDMPIKRKIELDVATYEKNRDNESWSDYVEVKPKKTSVTLKVG